VELEQQLVVAEEYNNNLHEEVHRLNNQLNSLLPHDNDDDEEMGSGVFMDEGDDDIEINGPKDVPSEEEEEDDDEELESASDEDGGEIFDIDSKDDAKFSCARVIFCAFHVWVWGFVIN
jgi:hypothetical protein